ncbi:uncharacterized protein EV420DRAFT_853206 [Desarmillaria tabescens]|uniref:DUF6533 domain-containing protein n=1 Tax=Armillaria tabescens TaxID=1929756 RepID=A0AA39MWE0_ARMTA|nr:uncharacterized protein EV420DRAFT_853206 [Desarmillaria tabescens]KAK0448310.1 hypothetical protein EV420DRAFT_853206 [Desarmillaria tabescens]
MDYHIFIQSLHDIRAVSYVLVASATLMIHEWSMLFEQEVTLIWHSPWNLVKILYLMSRYFPIIDVAIALQEHIQPRADPKICLINNNISTVSAGVGIAISELILIVRTCALYGNYKRAVYGLGLVWAIWVSANIWVLITFMKSTVFEYQPSSVLPGCYLASESPVIFVCFASLLLLEAVLLVLHVWKALRLLRGSRNALVSTFFRDGVIYYICLFPLALANVLVILLAPDDMLDLLDTLMRVFHSTMCCRLLLGLRQAAVATQRGSISTTLPISGHIAFGTQTVDGEGSMSTQDSCML